MDRGRGWRSAKTRLYTLPPDAPDFACPHGYPWGYQPPTLAQKIKRGAAGIARAITTPARPGTVAARNAICMTCPEKVNEAGGRITRCRICTCLVSAKIRDPKASCPKSPPSWGPESA
jgi:hypothetical protein